MKNSLVVLALFSSGFCFALSNPDEVTAECKRQMSAGICLTRPDRSAVTPGETMLLSGVGRVSYSAYMDYMELYNSKDPTDSAMCQLAQQYMNEWPGSDHDKIARSLWTPVHTGATSNQTFNWTEMGIKVVLAAVLAVVTFTLTCPRQSAVHA
jgi:hypothetical protein